MCFYLSYYLTPKSPTGASSIYLGENATEAQETLAEMGYTMHQALDALDGQELPSVDADSDTWTVTVEADR